MEKTGIKKTESGILVLDTRYERYTREYGNVTGAVVVTGAAVGSAFKVHIFRAEVNLAPR